MNVKDRSYNEERFENETGFNLYFINCTFDTCEFWECNYECANFINCTFINCTIPYSIFNLYNFVGCDLDFNLEGIKQEYLKEMRQVTDTSKLEHLAKSLEDGNFEGGIYFDGNCGCFYGTLEYELLQDSDPNNAVDVLRNIYSINEDSIIETFSKNISRGDNIEGNYFAKHLHSWVKEIINERNS